MKKTIYIWVHKVRKTTITFPVKNEKKVMILPEGTITEIECVYKVNTSSKSEDQFGIDKMLIS